MFALSSPPPAMLDAALIDLCAVYDVLLTDGAAVLSKAARTDLWAFSRLFDLPLEGASEVEVWREVRLRLTEDLETPLQIAPEWGYEDQKRAA